MPVLESSITLIADETLYYRGHDAVGSRADRVRRGRRVAHLDGPSRRRAPADAAGRRASARRRRIPFIARAQSALALASAADPQAFDLRPDGVARTGWRILDLLRRRGIDSTRARGRDDRRHARPRVARARGRRGSDSRGAHSVRRPRAQRLGIHGAVCGVGRINPYAVVSRDWRRSRASSTAAARRASNRSWRRRAARDRLRAALTERLRQGESIDGFGHPLYRDGDPRAAALLEMLAERFPRSPELRFVREFARVTASLTGESPTSTSRSAPCRACWVFRRRRA